MALPLPLVVAPLVCTDGAFGILHIVGSEVLLVERHWTSAASKTVSSTELWLGAVPSDRRLVLGVSRR